jgi:hypothetical protein
MRAPNATAANAAYNYHMVYNATAQDRSFYPNCTLPPVPVYFVASPNIRSTKDILYSSLATIVACTWSVLDLDVPIGREQYPSGWKGTRARSLQRSRYVVKSFIIACLAPEYIFAKAVSEFLWARGDKKRLQRAVPETRSHWTLKHMLFAQRGGLVIKHPKQQQQTDNSVEMAVASTSHTETRMGD